MKRYRTRLRSVQREDKKQKQRRYSACMLTRRPQPKINKDKRKKQIKPPPILRTTTFPHCHFGLLGQHFSFAAGNVEKWLEVLEEYQRGLMYKNNNRYKSSSSTPDSFKQYSAIFCYFFTVPILSNLYLWVVGSAVNFYFCHKSEKTLNRLLMVTEWYCFDSFNNMNNMKSRNLLLSLIKQ